jgi:predicted phage tail protein
MHEQRMRSGIDALEERVTRALERVPEVTVPAEFAARVALQVPMRREIAAMPARYGLMAMRISMAVLMIALVVVAMHAGGRSSIFGIAFEWMLCAELVGLAVWLGGVRGLIVPKA